MIHNITTGELKDKAGGDGLILQGCGGDPAEWLKGINSLLTEADILKNGGEFKNIYVFEHEGVTNILYPFDGMSPDTLDMGKLAIWRLQNHENFGGTWHSDYLNNKLGISIEDQNAGHEAMKDNFNRVPPPRYNNDEIDPDNPPPIVSFGERPSPCRDEGAEGPQASDIEDVPTHPIVINIENAFDANLYSFSVSLPIFSEELQPFLNGAEIADWRDMKIWEVTSDISGLGDRLYSIISDNGMTPDTLDELNYLATKIEGLCNNGHDIFCANIEAGRNCGSIAEMINLTFDANLNRFDIFPTFDEKDYGDTLVNLFTVDEHAIIFNRLKDSDDPADRAFAAHIEKLEKHVDLAAFGRTTVKEEGGVFTERGYLIGGDDLQQLYHGAQDIPAEHFLLSESARAVPHIMKIDDANIAEAIVKLHAVGCRSMESASANVKVFFDQHKDYAGNNDFNYLPNHYVLFLNRSDICIAPAMEVYKRGSEMCKFALSASELAAKGERSDIKMFAVRINNAHEIGGDKTERDLRGDLIELSPKAFCSHITRYAANPERVDALHDDGTKKSYDLFSWGQMLLTQNGDSAGLYTLHYSDISLKEASARFGMFMGNHEMMCHADSFENYLPTINALFNKSEATAENASPFMIRIANEAAREILARGDADVYRLTNDGGVVKLSTIEAARPMCFAELRNLAIKQKDAAGLEKWAAHKVKDIVRQAERAERMKQKNKVEEL